MVFMGVPEWTYLVSLLFALASIYVVYTQIKIDRPLLLSYLTLFLLVLALSNLMAVMIQNGWMVFTPHLYKVLMPFSLLTPVTSFWYVRGSLGGRYIPNKRDYFHLTPFFLVLVHYVPFYLTSKKEKLIIINNAIENNSEVINLSYGWIFDEGQIFVFRSVQAALYLYLSFRVIKLSLSNSELDITTRRAKTIIKWLKFFVRSSTIYLISISVCYFLLSLIYQGYELNEVAVQFAFSITALFVLTITSYLLLHPKALLSLEKPIDRIVFERNSIDLELCSKIIIDNNWHLDHSISLPQLLDKLSIKLNTFSSLVKIAGYKNYSEYLNSLRLKTFIERASEEELKRTSLEGIAVDCGFKSTATFYRVFKEKFGCTPKQYIERNKRG